MCAPSESPKSPSYLWRCWPARQLIGTLSPKCIDCGRRLVKSKMENLRRCLLICGWLASRNCNNCLDFTAATELKNLRFRRVNPMAPTRIVTTLLLENRMKSRLHVQYSSPVQILACHLQERAGRKRRVWAKCVNNRRAQASLVRGTLLSCRLTIGASQIL